MPDETAQSPNAGAEQSQLQELATHISDIQRLLRSQRDTLRQRGMNLPTEPLDNLRALKNQVDKLTKTRLDAQQELRSLRALASTTAIINSPQSTDEVLNQVMDTVIALTGAERGYIVMRNKTTDEMEFRVARGMDQAQLTDHERGISSTIVKRVADTGEPVLTDNASEDARYQQQDSIVRLALRSILAVPLKVRDEVIGVVYCDNRLVESLFKQHELMTLTAFANQAAVAIENARLFEDVRLRLRQVSDLQDRMNNLFKSVASGIITIDRANRILVSNAASEKLIGQQGVVGQYLHAVMPPVERGFYDAIERVRHSKEQELFEVMPDLGDGNRHYWNVIMSALRGDGDGGGVAIVLDDMTEKKNSESKLSEVKRYLPLALVENIRSIEDADMSGQEREISALFADVRGFTSFSERLEPGELMTIINKYLSLASDAINLYEGIVDKYMGDAVTGLFNTQLNPQDDHALRAVQAGIQLVYDLHAQHEIMPEDERLFYGIGIHTGPAVLGNVGGKVRQEFAALGEAPDIAKYLQEQAGPGEIIISQATFLQIGHVYDCDVVTEIRRPKSGFENVRMYRVGKRKKNTSTGSLFVDKELLELLSRKEDS